MNSIKLAESALLKLLKANNELAQKDLKGIPFQKKAVKSLLSQGKIFCESNSYFLTPRGVEAIEKILHLENMQRKREKEQFEKKQKSRQEILQKLNIILKEKQILSKKEAQEYFTTKEFKELCKTDISTCFPSRVLSDDQRTWFYDTTNEKECLRKIRSQIRKATSQKWFEFAQEVAKKHNISFSLEEGCNSKEVKDLLENYALSLAKITKKIHIPLAVLEKYIEDTTMETIYTPEGILLYPLHYFENTSSLEGYYTVTTSHIASYFKVTLPTVRNWLKKNNISPYNTYHSSFNRMSYLYLWKDAKVLFPNDVSLRNVLNHFEEQREDFWKEQEKKKQDKLKREQQKMQEIRDRVIRMFPIRIRDKELLPKIFFHVGPTNSGKTFKALERMMASENGIYLAPLRLLAWEVFEKINKTSSCTLLTGEEVIHKEDANFISATVEMFPQESYWDVVVLDEAQMAADSERGWAWTRVLSHTKAKELHICCIPEIQPFLEKFLLQIGYEDIVKYNYERLTSLQISKNISNLKAPPLNTIFIVFRRLDVLDLKNRFERMKIPTSIIYGSLPPEVRKNETEKFINGETVVCVATDAIGMGMNLPAQKVCFVKMEKFDGHRMRQLYPLEVKQIAGRAGRYGYHEYGEVGGVSFDILKHIKESFEQNIIWEDKIRISPTLLELENLEGSLFHRLNTWLDIRAIPSEYKQFIAPCEMQQRLQLALDFSPEEEKELGLEICFTLINAPVARGIETFWLRCVQDIYSYKSLPLPREPQETHTLLLEDLQEWESYVHKLDIFLWLHNRSCIAKKLKTLSDDIVFATQSRKEAINKINHILHEISRKRGL